jgi:hypothetical protein
MQDQDASSTIPLPICDVQNSLPFPRRLLLSIPILGRRIDSVFLQRRQLSKCFGYDAYGLYDLCFGDDERRCQADDVLVRGLCLCIGIVS